MLEYPFITDLAVIPVSQDSLDEWLHRFMDAISDRDGWQVSQQRFDETTKPFLQVCVTRREGESVADMLVGRADDNHLALFLGWKVEVDQESEEAILHSATVAVDKLGQEGEVHEWTALIGPPGNRIGGAEPRLENEAEIGPFQLSSTREVYWEMSPHNDFPNLGTAGVVGCVPIRVKSSHRGYSWGAASRHASRELNMLCSLLSTVWGTCLVVRSGPVPADMGEVFVPKREFWKDHKLDDEGYLNAPGAKSVPKWAKNAWRVMKDRPKLADAMAVYREALHAQIAHPSLALVAFIASIEVISQAIYRDDRCSECDSHKFISKKFTRTLELVMDRESAEQLGRTYSPRSRTVHQGKLHGTETIVGADSMSGLWINDEPSFFKWDTVYRMSKASRSLLEKALKGQLPKKQSFVPGE